MDDVKLDIALSHLSMNFLGGEEKLCLSFIEALKSSGHQVTLFTVEKTNWNSVKDFFVGVVKPDREMYTTSSTIHSKFRKTSNLALAYANYITGLIKLNSRGRYDLVINTYGDLINSLADVAYVHFPIKATLDYSQTPVFVALHKWRIYCQIYNLAASVLDNIKSSFLLTNSNFTQRVVKKYLKRDALVLHPPVDVEVYASKKAERENYVVTVSRFTPKRRLYRIPLIAKNTKNANFFIVGAADEYSLKTIQHLKKTISKCGVKDLVTLLPNVSSSKLIRLLAKAKVYLHAMPFDHFGISIIEAMAAGCVPIVHRSGGPWLDILDQQQGKAGFSYATLEEAAQLIDLVMTDENLRKKVSSAAQHRALNYSKSNFQQKLSNIVNRLTTSY